MTLQEWVEFIGSEYLETFVKDGGASVKFVVTPEALVDDLALALADQSRNLGCKFVKIDAARARVHMPQDIFFTIARQLDWRQLARHAVIRLAGSRDYLVEDVDPSDVGNIYAAIGEANGVDAAAVLRELRPAIQNHVFRNRKMARDFRVAMFQMCLAENFEYGSEYSAQPLIDWLSGSNTRISNVKHFYINTPINRTTARHFIESVFHWIKYAGYAGTVLLLDNRRVTVSRNPQDGLRFYTKAMLIDHYELLRELIDGVDRLDGVLAVVVTGVDFMNEDNASRGFGAYQALMTRVMNDVRDKNMINPTASLVRLSDSEVLDTEVNHGHGY